MGIAPQLSHGSLRLTTGIDNTDEQIDRFLGGLPEDRRSAARRLAGQPVRLSPAHRQVDLAFRGLRHLGSLYALSPTVFTP